MSWRDQLQAASFRGVPFKVESADSQHGRRVALHEFPKRDLPYPEDMGRRRRQFTLQAYVIGPNYMADRDRLEAVLEKSGPGKLVHPYRGELQVQVDDVRISESTREGGMARFTITFIEAGENKRPDAQTDTARIVDERATTATDTIVEDFVDEMDVGGPEWLRDAAESVLGDIADRLEAITIPSVTLPDALAVFVADIESIRANVSNLIQAPDTLASSLTGTIGRIASLFSDSQSSLKGYSSLFEYGNSLAAVSTLTVIRRRQATNQSSMINLVRRSAMIEAARTASRMEFGSYNEAVETRDTLADALDEQMLTANDEVYLQLQALRAAVVRDITTRGANLAHILTHTPGATLPALVISYQLYGDATHEADIVTRNKIRHPGFVPGGDPLEVLSNA